MKKHYDEKKKLKYVVTPNYGISNTLISAPKDAREQKINEIKNQEIKSVPTSISIQSSYFVQEGDKETEKSIYSGTLNNNIETDEKDYVI